MNFSASTLLEIEAALGGRKLEIIRIIGLGSFENCLPSLFQLILAEAIRDYFCVCNISSQDPITSNSEELYLKQHNINVISGNNLSDASIHLVFIVIFILIIFVNYFALILKNLLNLQKKRSY